MIHNWVKQELVHSVFESYNKKPFWIALLYLFPEANDPWTQPDEFKTRGNFGWNILL